MQETRPVRGYEEYYSADINGNVISYYISPSNPYGYKVLKPVFNKYNGYVSLRLGNAKTKPRSKYLHRIIAECFIDNPENKPCVNHKDGNKLNNCASNLEWCTHAENTAHARMVGLMAESPRDHLKNMNDTFSKKHSIPINAYDCKTNELIWSEPSMIEAYNKHKMSTKVMRNIINGTRKEFRGIYFQRG